MMTEKEHTGTDSQAWTKSSLSFPNGNCVELNVTETVALLRNSREPDGPVLVFTHQEWDDFLQGAARGEFDLPETKTETDKVG